MAGLTHAPKTTHEPLDLWADDGVTNPEVPTVVLVVDDSRLQREMLSKSLRKWGYEVLEAESGQDGLEICKKREVGMIISDWMMPGMNGPEFCCAFRQLDRDEYGYFILLTSKGEAREVAEGLNSGADDFLTKPVNYGELRARMRAGERIVDMHAQLVQKNHIVNDTLATMRKLYDGLHRDLNEARKLQQSLVRDTEIALTQGNIALMLRPSGHVGGDLVGQFRINNDEVGLFSLDVSGHGVTSALMTARLAGYLSGLTPSQNIAMIEAADGTFTARDPGETAAKLNDTLLRELETDHYFTIALAIVDLKLGRVRCTQAGHPHPMIQRGNGDLKIVGDGGMPVGLLPSAQYPSFEFQLRSGDRLVLYSDGITEACNPLGKMLDEAGLAELLQGYRCLSGKQSLDRLLVDVQEYCGSADISDDVSALIFDYSPEVIDP